MQWSYGLLKISEAVKNLIRENIDLPSSQPWQDIYNLGNQLRHSYFNIGRREDLADCPLKTCHL